VRQTNDENAGDLPAVERAHDRLASCVVTDNDAERQRVSSSSTRLREMLSNIQMEVNDE
jgi:hypothetical protein